MLKAAIIGAGPQGLQALRALTAPLVGGLAPEDVAVIDPHALPGQVFRRRLETCLGDGGTLRTCWMRNVDSACYATIAPGRHWTELHGDLPISRFWSHADEITGPLLSRCRRVTGAAMNLEPVTGGLRVRTEDADVNARNIILALGSEIPPPPRWAAALAENNPGRIFHLLDPDFSPLVIPPTERVAVIGAGYLGARFALDLSRRQAGHVTLVVREDVRISEAEYPPDWFDRLARLARIDHPADRLKAVLAMARWDSILPDTFREIGDADEEENSIGYFTGEVVSAREGPNGGVNLLLDSGAEFTADRIVFAGAFTHRRPGGEMLRCAIAELGLVVGAGGLPVANPDMSWRGYGLPAGAAVYVMGTLALTALGPAAPFLAGGSEAARRIARAVRASNG